MVTEATTDPGVPPSPEPKFEWMTRLARHFRQPHGLFQIAGMVGVTAIFIGHLRDQPAEHASGAPLTMANQDLFGHLFARLFDDPTFPAGMPFAALMFLTFTTALLVVTSGRPHLRQIVVPLVCVQLFVGLFYNNDLLLVLAAQYPIVFLTRHAIGWLLLQSAGMTAVWGYVLVAAELPAGGQAQSGLGAVAAAFSSDLGGQVGASLLMFGAWQSFAFCLGYVAMRERRNHDRLTATNAQLVAAQQLLAESARSGERLRLARELHDGLGHHLTALGLHLELATHQVSGAQASSVRTAREIARKLLQEVRNAVSQQRDEAPIDLQQSLRTMCTGIPTLNVRFACEPECAITDPALAHDVFRCVQEALSNAMRHADARNVSVVMVREGNGVRVSVDDDGHAPDHIVHGNGLRGMRERVDAGGGTLDIHTGSGKGFRVSIWLPQRRVEP